MALALIRPRRQARWGVACVLPAIGGVVCGIAEIDRGHHHEALYIAEQERERAKEIVRRSELVVGVRGEVKAVRKTVTPGRPRTLMQAHRELVDIRPSRDASLAAWFEYYQHSVLLYEQTAEIDPGHELEAMYWARRERHRAEQIEARIRAERPRK